MSKSKLPQYNYDDLQFVPDNPVDDIRITEAEEDILLHAVKKVVKSTIARERNELKWRVLWHGALRLVDDQFASEFSRQRWEGRNEK